ncbi:hypothetical protein LDENG_00201980 [Lucifuga dentata]|nr:hypothetical protein LDENG_00201980 [Lucifuga dentata]
MSSLNCPFSCFYCLICIYLFVHLLVLYWFLFNFFTFLYFTCSLVYHLCPCFIGSLTELFLNFVLLLFCLSVWLSAVILLLCLSKHFVNSVFKSYYYHSLIHLLYNTKCIVKLY